MEPNQPCSKKKIHVDSTWKKGKGKTRGSGARGAARRNQPMSSDPL